MGVPWSKSRLGDMDKQWLKQNLEAETNPMYSFVSLGKGGSLNNAYNCIGDQYTDIAITDEMRKEAVVKLARETMEPFLYPDHVNGQLISELEYVRWKGEKEARMTVPYDVLVAEPANTRHCNLADKELLSMYGGEFTPHYACWRLDKRGGVGETPFHLLYLEGQTEIAAILLELYPAMALDVYETEEYLGEGALHIAIVFENISAVKLLIEKGADVNQRAIGSFFLPDDQKTIFSIGETNYKGFAYYGEYPLSFAISIGNTEIYDHLLLYGARPNAQDRFGNTVLHMAVIHNQPDLLTHAVKHHNTDYQADMTILNKAGLTPLTLATKLGRNQMFNEMLELDSQVFWQYSNIKCSVYPLAALDTINTNGETNRNSALFHIINGGTDEHLEMIEGGVIRQLLDDKWKTFAKRRFFERLVLASLHLIFISIAVYTRPSVSLWEYRGAIDAVRYSCEIAVCLYCIIMVLFQFNEIHMQGFIGFMTNSYHAPAKTIFVMSSILIIACLLCRMLSRISSLNEETLHQVEDTLLIIAVPGSWVYLLLFARSVKITGPFVTMVYQMVTGDVFRFGIIFVIFLTGFTQAFFFLFRNIPESSGVTSYLTLQGTVMTLFQMTLGEFRYEEFDYTRYPLLTKLVFGIFMILAPILLLNMLIAMMGNTYQLIIAKSEKEWKKQWAKIVVVLEHSHMKSSLKRFQNEYSIEMSSDPSQPRPGIMVIKSTNKTKAKQRKDAISNWKNATKQIIGLLKEAKEAQLLMPVLSPRSTSTLAPLTPMRRRSSSKLAPHSPLPRRSSSQLSPKQPRRLSSHAEPWGPLVSSSKDDFADHLTKTVSEIAFVHDLDISKPKSKSVVYPIRHVKRAPTTEFRVTLDEVEESVKDGDAEMLSQKGKNGISSPIVVSLGSLQELAPENGHSALTPIERLMHTQSEKPVRDREIEPVKPVTSEQVVQSQPDKSSLDLEHFSVAHIRKVSELPPVQIVSPKKPKSPKKKKVPTATLR